MILHVAAVEYTAVFLLVPQLQALRRAGYDVRVACAPGPGGFHSALEPFGPVPVAFPRALRPLAMLRAGLQLVRVVRRVRPAVLHLHSPAAAIVARCVPRMLLPRGLKVVYTVHGFAHLWESSSLRDRLLERVERVLSRRTDVMLFQSREDLDGARAAGYRAELVYLGNGVADEWFTAPVVTQRSQPLRALFIGRLVREKGLVDLLDALERVDSVHLEVAGGQLESERDGVADVVERRARSGSLAGRVELLGVVPADELRHRVVASNVVVLPSYREGMPRSLIEGLAGARPAVATDIRGCRELVEDGVNGLLVAPGDVEGLAAALRFMVQADDETYGEMCRQARDGAWRDHRETAVFERLLDAYQGLGVAPPR